MTKITLGIAWERGLIGQIVRSRTGYLSRQLRDSEFLI